MSKTITSISGINAALVHDGKLNRFSRVLPGTGKRGKPGYGRLNDLPRGDVLIVDEVTGAAIQAANGVSTDEAAGALVGTY